MRPWTKAKCCTAIERRRIGVAGELADLALDREGAEPLDELLARLPVGDEVGDRDAAQPVLVGEGLDLRRPS